MKDESLRLHLFPAQYFMGNLYESAIHLNPLPFNLTDVKINAKVLLLVNTSKSGQ